MSDRYWPLIFIFLLISGMVAAGAYFALDENEPSEVGSQETQPIATVQPTISPTPPPPTPTATPVLNRLDCDSIRGTEYLSGEERTWFLANCVTGASSSEIEGTDFCTTEDRVWYQANCATKTPTPETT